MWQNLTHWWISSCRPLLGLLVWCHAFESGPCVPCRDRAHVNNSSNLWKEFGTWCRSCGLGIGCWQTSQKQSSWGPHGAHLGPVGPILTPCWFHELCYQIYPIVTNTWYHAYISLFWINNSRVHGTKPKLNNDIYNILGYVYSAYPCVLRWLWVYVYFTLLSSPSWKYDPFAFVLG